MKRETLGSHRSTYDAVFQHPVARNLDWRDLRSMLGSLSEVEEAGSGTVKFTRNGQSLTLHPPRHKDFSDVHALMDVRHFLERSGVEAPEEPAAGVHLLVVIDHREARVYRAEIRGSVPQRVVPYTPGGFGRHLHDVREDGDGHRKPERKSYYESVANTLNGAEQILLFGSGTGASSAMDQLLAALRRDHADVAGRDVGSHVVDAQHLTEHELLAKARDFYANVAS
ncbi:MAG: hypothetical protein JWO31_2693 [Phycisphaerales bacterium]|nr:hypothetical protein [Phycisphaerales bacterium]